MKFEQTTPVLLPVYGKAAESLKRTLEKPSRPRPITQEERDYFYRCIALIDEELEEKDGARAKEREESL